MRFIKVSCKAIDNLRMQAEVLGMFHPRLQFRTVLIFWLCLSAVGESFTLQAQNSPPRPGADPKVINKTNYVTITNYVTVTNFLKNYVTVSVLPPKVDAAKVEAESKRIKQNVLEYQLKRAKAGDPRALYDVGVRYLTGDGVEKDREKALDYLRQSAKDGELLAQRKLQDLGETVAEPK